MKFNKQELRKAAEKATEGNYVVGHCDINKHGNLSSVYVCQEWNGMAGGVVAECHVNCLTKNSDQVYANAGFMALASPANVISLLEEISTLESRCAELAAENAGLKQAITTHSQSTHFCEVCGKDDPCSTDDVCYVLNETPATDAFLAEVRAQGVKSLSNAVQSVISERQRQQSVEGWTPEHDDEHAEGEMAEAAACYAMFANHQGFSLPAHWPWSREWWKQSGQRRDLVKAGALILAEIERIDRQDAAQ